MVVTQTIRTLLVTASLIAMSTTSMEAAAAEGEDPFNGRLLPLELVMTNRNEIGLTAEQKKQIRELVVGVQQAVAGQRWEMQTAYFELMEVLDEPTVNEELAISLARKAVDTENEIKLEQMRLLIRLRNLLTPEQVATLKARRAELLGNTGG